MALRSVVIGVMMAIASTACAEGASIQPTSGSGAATGTGGADGTGGAHGSAGGDAGPGSTSSSPISSATSSSGDGGSGQGAGGPGQGAGGAGGAGPATSTATSGAGHVDQTCNPGEYVTAIAPDDTITCAPFAAPAQAAVAASCRVYLGWADGCGACTTTPTKWGYATTAQCANGAGLDNTCLPTTLGATTTQLFGLNTDGDVDDNDKLYGSLHCGTGDTGASSGPCAAGSFATGRTGNAVTCTPASGLALGYVRSSCHLYMGWQDGCNGCTTLPTKWGHVNDGGCVTGAGVNDTCTVASLGGESVQLLGINTGGDVNNDDKFYWGLRCDDPTPASSETENACPVGQLVHGVRADGTLVCEAPNDQTATVFRDRCTLYAGWRDSCSGCTDAPSKWGSVRANACANGLGVDNTCATFLLGADMVQMFGLNTDGDVGNDDKFHIAFKCE